MAKDTSIINILTYGLPYDLARPIYNEYQDRLKEANYLINNIDKYAALQPYSDTVELLLALSIFHKRVISNLDAAIKFHGTVYKYSSSDIVRIGNYELNSDEKNKINALLISYRKMMNSYNLVDRLWDYVLTKEFLTTLLDIQKVDEFDNRDQ